MIKSPNPQERQAAYGRLASPLFTRGGEPGAMCSNKTAYIPMGAEYRGPFPGGPRFRFSHGRTVRWWNRTEGT